jgi:hypothetical protein
MSHFVVMVVGEDVEEQLAPYHEFECTGENDQYVIDVDMTEDTREDYESHGKGETFVEFVKDWDGYEAVEYGATPDIDGAHKYGYFTVDENNEVVKVIRRTNPNRKWDWYTIGGRWHGFFKLKPTAVGAGALGAPGLQTLNSNYKSPDIDKADQCLKGMIDVEAMRNEAGDTAAAMYDHFTAVTAGCAPFVPYDETMEDRELAGKQYREQEIVQAMRKDDRLMWYSPQDFKYSREEYIDKGRNGAACCFALLKDGQWYERGKMGWWGHVSDEKDGTEWRAQFNAMFDSLPDDTLLTVVDCHI